MRLIQRLVLLVVCLFFLMAAFPIDFSLKHSPDGEWISGLRLSSAVYAQESIESVESEEMFDFGTVDTDSLHSAEKPPPPGHPIFYVIPAVFFMIVFVVIFLLWLKAKNASRWQPFFLGRLPISFKLLITLCLCVYGLVHIAALINVYIQTNIVYSNVAEYFFYMPIQKLTGATHAHLFGHSTMYALTAIAFMFTRATERIKIPVVAAAFLGAPLDLYSWWLIKYWGANYEILSAISGTAISVAFLTMYTFVLLELWFLREPSTIAKEKR